MPLVGLVLDFPNGFILEAMLPYSREEQLHARQMGHGAQPSLMELKISLVGNGPSRLPPIILEADGPANR